MFEAFNVLTGFEKVFWFAAIPASGVFLIQLIMTLIGAETHAHSFDNMHHDTPSDTVDDHDTGSHFALLTFRNLIVFFMMFGWVGIALVHDKTDLTTFTKVVTIAVSIGVGLIMMVIVAFMLLGISKLVSSGNVNINESIVGLVGKVYLSIPSKGTGKITIDVSGKTIELRATTLGDAIPTGVSVKIVSIKDKILTVEKI